MPLHIDVDESAAKHVLQATLIAPQAGVDVPPVMIALARGTGSEWMAGTQSLHERGRYILY
jgi:hypothetical protein